MINKFQLMIIVGLVVTFGCTGKSDDDLAKLYPESVSITVINTLDIERQDEILTIDVDQITSVKGNFNSRNFVILSGDQELHSQAVDVDRDDKDEQIVIITDFAPGEQRSVTIRYNAMGSKKRDYPQRAQAEISVKTGGEFVDRKYIGGEFMNVDHLELPAEHTDHSNYIRYEGPGWESDKVGYRFYLDWRNATDIFGKKNGAMVLQDVGQDGFDSYHEPADWGMDILKVGESLGIGSIGMWVDGKAERVANTSSIAATIAANGPVEATVATNYKGWQIGSGTYDIESIITIAAGSRMTEHQLQISPVPENLCTGLVKHPEANIFSAASTIGDWTYLASWGQQSLVPDQLGMAIIYRRDELIELTADEHSDVVVLKPVDGKLTYYFAAAWEQELDGITSDEAFRAYLDNEIKKLNAPLEIVW